MRHLILLRHAKSSWVNPELDDMERPLNKRGKRSAKALGKWFRKSKLHPDLVLCSSARRTRETWDGLGLAGKPDLREDLYHASTNGLLSLLKSIDAPSVLVIGHNPGIGGLAHLLLAKPPEHPRFADYPTGSTLVAAFDIKTFSKIEPHTGVVRNFLTPHDLIDHAT